MWPDRVSIPGPLTYESGALPTALRGPALEPLKFDCIRFILICIIKKSSISWSLFDLSFCS